MNTSIRIIQRKSTVTTNDHNITFRLKNINEITLHVNASFDENHLVSLVKNLSNLEQMSIFHNKTYQINFDIIKQMLQYANQLSDLFIIWPTNDIQYFDENDYNKLLKLVKNRSTHKKLNLNLRNITTFFDDSNGIRRKLMVFEKDSEWLCVSNYFEYAY